MHSNSLLKAALKHRNLPPNVIAKRENEVSGGEGSANSPSQPAVKKAAIAAPPPPPPVVKRSCLCAPTSHPGSFRCRFHRSRQRQWAGRPLSSAIKTLPRPSTSEGVLSSSSSTATTTTTTTTTSSSKGAVLPFKKFVPVRSSISAHETTRPSRLSRMEVAASVSSNSETSASRCSTPGSCNLDATVPQLEQIVKDEGSAEKVQDVVEITSNTAVLEDDYKCALRVIQISQTASEFATDHPVEVASL